MKKVLFVVAALLLFANLNSQETNKGSDFHFTIKTNPLAAMGGPLYVAFVPLTGEYKVLFEVRTTNRQSIEAGLSYLGPSVLINLDEITDNDSISGVNTNGYRVQLMYKFFLTKESPLRGFYVAPHFSFARANIANKQRSDDKFVAAKLNANILMGYQLITNGGFALNIYTGLGFKLRDYDIPEGSDFDFDIGNHATPNVTLGLSFGYAF